MKKEVESLKAQYIEELQVISFLVGKWSVIDKEGLIFME